MFDHILGGLPLRFFEWYPLKSILHMVLLVYKWGVSYRLMILGVVTYVLVVARTGTPTVPTALGVPYDYTPAVTRVLVPSSG